MSTQDLEKVDKLCHALKCLATYSAMKDAEEYSEDNWNSGRRGREMNRPYSNHPEQGYYYPPMRSYSDQRW